LSRVRERARAGDDCLFGLAGDDRVSGGTRDDKIRGDNGNDTISARDGARDTIDCGAGRDKVTADRTDTVKSNCEYVKRAVRRAGR
jgi:Ca2+-binding RTX toxin-like protein